MGRIDQDQVREIVGAGRTKHAALESLRHQSRQIADVIQVRVRQDDGVDRRGRNREILPVAAAQLIAALEQTAIHENAVRPRVHEMLRPGHGSRRAEEGQRGHARSL